MNFIFFRYNLIKHKAFIVTKIQNAIFIGDSHYNSSRTQLESLLLSLFQNNTHFIFLCGDIFDFLSCDIKYFKNINQKPINLINSLSETKNIIYLEGNHDFNLKDIFPKCHIIPREVQPYVFELQGKTIAISHGDIYTPFVYNIYAKVIRARAIGKLLNFFDIGGVISKIVEKKLKAKHICKEIKSFDNFATNRSKLYHQHQAQIVIEAHYHQGKRYKNYINIPGFACDKRYITQDDIV